MTTILERNKNIKKPVKKTYAEYAEDALYREVWEDVNNEKTQQFVKKYWKYIVGAVIAIMVIVSGVQFGVQKYRASKMAVAVVYETALTNVDAAALANIARNSKGASSDLAMFQSYLIDKDVKKLEQLVEAGHTRDFKDLARLHIATIKGDKMGTDEFVKFLAPMDTKKSPFYYTARLMVAEKYIAANDKVNADKILHGIINDLDAPRAVSAHAQMLK